MDKALTSPMTLTFDRDFDPRYGEAVELLPGVRRVTAANPGPFTFAGTNTFLVGTAELALIDPGPDDPDHIEALRRAIGGARVTHILVSHTHRDHSAGTERLKAMTGAQVLAAGPHAFARPPHAGENRRIEAAGDTDFTPDATLADGDIVEASGAGLQAIATPGHTVNHIALALLDEGVLFSGDHVMGWSTTIVAPPDGAMAVYMASLDRLLARSEHRYLPAHGGEINDGHAYAEGLKAHRVAREAAILEALGRGHRTIPEIVAAVYQGLEARLAPAAALSTLAHLEDLIARGAITADGPPALSARYRPKDASPDEDLASGSS